MSNNDSILYAATMGGLYPSENSIMCYKPNTQHIQAFVQANITKAIDFYNQKITNVPNANIRPLEPVKIIKAFNHPIINGDGKMVDIPTFVVLPSKNVIHGYRPINSRNDDLFDFAFYNENNGAMNYIQTITDVLTIYRYDQNRKDEISKMANVKSSDDEGGYLRDNIRLIRQRERKTNYNDTMVSIIYRPLRTQSEAAGSDMDCVIVALDTIKIIRAMLCPVIDGRPMNINKVQVEISANDWRQISNDCIEFSAYRTILSEDRNRKPANSGLFSFLNNRQ